MAKHRGHNDGTISERTYKRQDGTVIVRFVAQLPIDAAGKRPSLGSFKTRTEAKDALREALAKALQGMPVSGKTPSVKEHMEAWIAGRTKVAYGTRMSYGFTLQNIAPYIGRIPLDKLTEAHIKSMWNKLAAGIAADGGPRRSIAASTLETSHKHVTAALNAAVKSRHIPLFYNPASAEEAKPDKPEHKEIFPLTEEEVKRLLAVTVNDREYPLWATFIATGIRQGEAQYLRWEHIDFERKTLSVCGSMHPETGRGLVPGPTKTKRNRLINLPPHLVPILKVHKARQNEMRLAAGPLWHDKGLVFTTDTGLSIDRGFVAQKFAQALDRAGIHRRSPHQLRHTFASLCLKKNVHAKIVQEALGHSSIKMTLDQYSHLIPTIQEEAANQLNALFG